MISRHLNRNIIARVCLLACNSIATGWLLYSQKLYIAAGLLLLLFIYQVVELIYFLNRTNRQIAYFFDAIRNDDSTLSFPLNTGNKALDELNISLNKVNELIKTIKFDLREQEQYYSAILENVPIGILTYNEKGTIFLANTAAKKLVGHQHLNHILQIIRTDRKLFNAIKELELGSRQLFYLRDHDVDIQLSLKSTRFVTSHENFYLVVIQDIKNELEARELESWIKLIRVLTHEIMNTVAPITSLSETILGYYKNMDGQIPDEKVIKNTVKGLEVINERGKGLISFVETYRKLTRLPRPEKKPEKIGQLFDEIITLIHIEPLDKKITIHWEVLPEDLEISIDKKQISQVLINLIKNAYEALKNTPSGMITLKGEINKSGRALISVTDNGPGIPVDIMDKIFIPFFTTKDSGSGIGLSLSRQIMLLHGGSLQVESLAGATTFKMIF